MRARPSRATEVFSSAQLSKPTMVHRRTCRGALGENGKALDGRCSCPGGEPVLEPADLVVVILVEGDAALVKAEGCAPTWVKAADLEATSEKPRTRRPPLPPDLVTLRAAGDLHYGRVRRVPSPGEIVFLRADRENQTPLRFLCSVVTESGPEAVLIDPDIDPLGAMDLDWRCTELRPFQGRLSSLLRPAFPLPDGTESPGWAQEKRD